MQDNWCIAVAEFIFKMAKRRAECRPSLFCRNLKYYKITLHCQHVAKVLPPNNSTSLVAAY